MGSTIPFRNKITSPPWISHLDSLYSNRIFRAATVDLYLPNQIFCCLEPLSTILICKLTENKNIASWDLLHVLPISGEAACCRACFKGCTSVHSRYDTTPLEHPNLIIFYVSWINLTPQQFLRPCSIEWVQGTWWCQGGGFRHLRWGAEFDSRGPW